MDRHGLPLPEAYRQAGRAATIGLVINIALGVTKLVGGLVAGSFALVADAVNSIGDSVGSVVVLVALRIARRPADANHPYGHARAEAVAASNVALLVIISALLLGAEAIRRFGLMHDAPPSWALAIAASNVVIKEALYRYKLRVARRTGSAAMLANAWDHRADALSSFAVLVGLAAIALGGEEWIWADEVAALFVVVMILVGAVPLFRDSARDLLDAQAEPEFVRSVRECAGKTAGVLGVEKLWIRKSGLEYLAEIHVEVAPDRTVSDGHRIGHDVQDRLQARFPRLRHVLVHLEPHGGDSASLPGNAPQNKPQR
jgi:cation diffusion facilitator family transporter